MRLRNQPYPVLALALLMLALSVLACDVNNPPTWTPSAPQQTAIILNGTYQADATRTTQASEMSTMVDNATLEPTGTPTITATPTASPAPGIVEITETPGGPIEVGTPINGPPTGLEIHQGTFRPYLNWNVRDCPGCMVIGGLVAGRTYLVQGVMLEADGSTWLCQVAVRDLRGAEYCGPAFLFRKPGGEPSGALIWGER